MREIRRILKEETAIPENIDKAMEDVLSGILANIISGKILMISKKRSQKSSNTQKHRELQLTVFLGFQAACVLSGIF